jgi:predicted nucleic acid-binding protein
VAEIALVDTSVIVASINVRDPRHRECVRLFERAEFDRVFPMLCVAEVSHLLNRDVGPEAEAGFLESLLDEELVWPITEDLTRMVQLVRQYADFPLGGVDASIVALAERVGARTVFTLDRRHFLAIRPHHVEAFTLLPEL